jgi:adenylosuccinate synthase
MKGKGKVTHHLLKDGGYTHCVRFNGGPNAGHTIYHNGVKLVTHHIPAGVFFGVTSIIGNGCVVDPVKLFEEIEYLESHGINVREHLKIAENAHIITSLHLKREMDPLIGINMLAVAFALVTFPNYQNSLLTFMKNLLATLLF